jgi:hypothetical protein
VNIHTTASWSVVYHELCVRVCVIMHSEGKSCSDLSSMVCSQWPSCKDAAAEREFRSMLETFHIAAAAEMAACSASLDAAKASFRSAAEFYGENMAKVHIGQEPERFTRLIRDFASLIDKAKKDRG